MPFLLPNQQCQSTKGRESTEGEIKNFELID